MLRLKRVLDDTPIGMKGYAKLLDVSDKTLYNKLTCATDFSYPEYQKLKALLPEYNLDYLLTEDPSPPMARADPDTVRSRT